jgi:fructose-bisphosphate aldolase, class I
MSKRVEALLGEGAKACSKINSGGASGANDLQEAVRTAVINKRGGGMGLISGRKAFQRPMRDGVELLNAIRDVYLDGDITVA